MKQASKELSVVVVMPTLDICGGIERFFMNYYAYMPRDIHFLIITHHSDSKNYQKMITARGDRLLILPKFGIKNYLFIKRTVSALLKNNNFDVMHCQMANAGFLYLRLAKKYGIKNRILHSHQCKYADKQSHAIRNMPCIFLAKKYANSFVACGEDAGKFMFGKAEYKILNNALNPEYFKTSSTQRSRMRERLNIGAGKILLGSIGRLEPQKNHLFSMSIIEACEAFELLIIGNGSEKSKLYEYAKRHHILNRVHFVESAENIIDYYSAIDALIMPSIYEGLPLVGVEAQFCGLPCYFSDQITKELKISQNTHFIGIESEKSANEWSRIITATLKNGNTLNGDADRFIISKQVKRLTKVYSGDTRE